MIIKFNLVASAGGSIRAIKGTPSLKPDEIVIGVNLELPAALFKRRSCRPTLTVPESAINPTEISVETHDEITKSVKAATGFDLKITVVPPTEPES